MNNKKTIVCDFDGVLSNTWDIYALKLGIMPNSNNKNDFKKIENKWDKNYIVYPIIDENLFREICKKFNVIICSAVTTNQEMIAKMDFLSKFPIFDIKFTKYGEDKIITDCDYFIEDNLVNLNINKDKYKQACLILNCANDIKNVVSMENLLIAGNINDMFTEIMRLEDKI